MSLDDDTVERVLAYWRGRESERGPAGVVSVVLIDQERFVVAPERWRERLGTALPGDLASLVEVLGDDVAGGGGEARLAYGDASTLRLVPMHGLTAIADDDARLAAMEAVSDPSEWREASADEACDVRVGVVEANALVALATLRAWNDEIGQVSVFTASHARGRGVAAGAGSAVVEQARTRGLVPQWRSRLGNGASARVADKLGFVALGTQVFVRVQEGI
jgi:GNAT superfamily N-acetyltransferase